MDASTIVDPEVLESQLVSNPNAQDPFLANPPQPPQAIQLGGGISLPGTDIGTVWDRTERAWKEQAKAKLASMTVTGKDGVFQIDMLEKDFKIKREDTQNLDFSQVLSLILFELNNLRTQYQKTKTVADRDALQTLEVRALYFIHWFIKETTPYDYWAFDSTNAPGVCANCVGKAILADIYARATLGINMGFLTTGDSNSPHAVNVYVNPDGTQRFIFDATVQGGSAFNNGTNYKIFGSGNLATMANLATADISPYHALGWIMDWRALVLIEKARERLARAKVYDKDRYKAEARLLLTTAFWLIDRALRIIPQNHPFVAYLQARKTGGCSDYKRADGVIYQGCPP